MNSKIIAYFIAIAAIVSVSMVAQCAEDKMISQASRGKKLWEDARIGISLDKIERTKVIPPDIKDKDSFILPSELKHGHDYIIIRLTIERIKTKNGGILSSIGYKDEKPTLIDTERHEYEMVECRFSKKTNLSTLPDFNEETILKSVLSSGSKGYCIFVLPEYAKLTKLNFVYSFLEAKSENRGQIDIFISKNAIH